MIFSFFVLVITAIIFSAGFTGCYNLLLLGDSVDRLTAIEWCELKKRQGYITLAQDFWSDTLTYKNDKGRVATYYCKANGNTIAFVHIFGSNATGPYLNNAGKEEIFGDTKARLNHSVLQYQSLFGVIDRIILQTAMWDRHYISQNHIDAETFMFRNNMLLRIDELKHITKNKTDIGLRTAVWSAHSGLLLHKFNCIIREIVIEKNMSFYDFDHDVWSTVNFDYSKESFLFQDLIHPKQMYTAMAGEKMLGSQFSKETNFGDRKSSKHCWIGNDTVVYILQDIITNSTFYFDTTSNSRHENPSDAFIGALRLGPSDICSFTGPTFYETTLLGVNVTNFLIDGMIYNSTLTKGLLYFRALSLRPFENLNIILGLGKSDSQVIQSDNQTSFWLSLIHLGHIIPKAFSNNLDWLMKTKDSKQVYLVRNGSRIILTHLPKAINLTFDDVVIVDPKDVKLLPLASNDVN
jgi:hypothetical protein